MIEKLTALLQKKTRGMRVMKKSRIIQSAIFALMLSVFAGSLCGCEQADRVSSNISRQADNFNVIRQITVINCIQGDVLFQMTGKMSLEVDEIENQLEITVEDENGS